MGKDGRIDQRIATLPSLHKPLGHIDVSGWILGPGCGEIDHCLRRHAAQPRLEAGPGNFILVKIAIRHGGDAAEQQFCGGQFAAPVDHFRRITSYNVCYTKLLRHAGG